MWDLIFWGLVIYSLGLITGPLVLFSLLRVVLKVLRRRRKT